MTGCELDHQEGFMRIADVLRNKGHSVATVTPETSVSGLLNELTVHNIGAMVVVSPDGVLGIVSERDVVRKLHEIGAELLLRPVSEIMTALVATCSPDDSVDSLAALMTTNRVRHVPVMVAGRLAGIVSIGDVVKTRMEELEHEHQQLQAYITQG
ncbi:signal transduction protein [Mycolicibacterium duvalii]|uniref:Signal transduction protein n=2 Tax=Mycolicibacterium duvalii TaxID=39688 RepID=A0A7I7JVJ0_9MYCO|nr:signal transduction protein [Mycolicibacterium duvalii]